MAMLNTLMSNPMLMMGLGMLGQAGPSRNPTNAATGAMQGLQMGQQAQTQQQQMLYMQQLMQEKKAEEERKRLQQQAIASMISGLDPEQQSLATAFPKQYAKSMLTPSEPSAFAEKLALAGIDPNTPEGQSFVREAMTRPTTSVSLMVPPKPPTGYQYTDLSDPRAGIERMQGYRESPEVSGKRAALGVGYEAVQTVRSAVVNPQGAIDRKLVGTMQGNVPWSKGREIRQTLEDATQAKLRAETGAAANKEEIASILDRYMPNLLDSDEGIKAKLDRLDIFFKRAIKETDPALYEALMTRGARTTEPGKLPWELNR